MILWFATVSDQKQTLPKFDYAVAGYVLGFNFESPPDIQQIPYRFDCGEVMNIGDFLLETRSKFTSSMYTFGYMIYAPSDLCYLGIVEIDDKRIILFDAYIDGVRKELPYLWYYGYFIHTYENGEEFFYLLNNRTPRVIRHDKSVVIRRKDENTLK